jgi:hypothetical protein
MNYCITCIYRNEEGFCNNEKLKEGYDTFDYIGDKDDSLIYQYYEGGGGFWVGPNFGCIHHAEK